MLYPQCVPVPRTVINRAFIGIAFIGGYTHRGNPHCCQDNSQKTQKTGVGEKDFLRGFHKKHLNIEFILVRIDSLAESPRVSKEELE